MTNLASLDGTIGPADELRIPVTDEGLLRGDGAFEVMRLYGGRPYALADHDMRLRHRRGLHSSKQAIRQSRVRMIETPASRQPLDGLKGGRGVHRTAWACKSSSETNSSA